MLEMDLNQQMDGTSLNNLREFYNKLKIVKNINNLISHLKLLKKIQKPLHKMHDISDQIFYINK
jgi:hypothetical protein